MAALFSWIPASLRRNAFNRGPFPLRRVLFSYLQEEEIMNCKKTKS